VVAGRLRDIGVEAPYQLGTLFMAGSEELAELTRGVEPLDDDRPGQMRAEVTDASEVGGDHRPLLELARGRAAFRSSEFIRDHWPAALREESDRRFATRSVAHQWFFGDQSRLVERLPELHRLLTETELQTAVLWQLNTTATDLRVAHRALADGVEDAAVHRRLGEHALSERRFDAAAAQFARARAISESNRDALYLRIYALHMAGRSQEADELARAELVPGAIVGDRRFLAFVADAFEREPAH
jgi:hypothetical protein